MAELAFGEQFPPVAQGVPRVVYSGLRVRVRVSSTASKAFSASRAHPLIFQLLVWTGVSDATSLEVRQ